MRIGVGDKLELVGRADLQPVERQRADDHLLDRVVGQHLRATATADEPVSSGSRVGSAVTGELLERADGLGLKTKIGDGRHGALGHGIHHARLRQDVNPMRPAVGQLVQRRIAHRRHHGPLDHAIGQQFVGDSRHLGAVEIAFDQVAANRGDGQLGGQMQFGGRGGHFRSADVRLALGGVNVNFPKHRGSSSQG